MEALDMENVDKIGALDFVISVLKEHEKELDRLVSRLEKAVECAEDPDDRELLRRFYE